MNQGMILQLILSSCWAFLITIFAVPSIVRIAHLKNILDQPNLRTVHEELTPRLGGTAMFAGFMSALTLFSDLDNGVQQLLAGCVMLFFIGLKDDLITVSALKKFSVQLLATGIVMFISDVRITSFQGIFGIGELTIGLSYGFTFIMIIGITNSVNLIDGLDGLAGTIVLIISITFGVYFYLYGGDFYGNYATVAFCLVGGLLGFLRYNFYKASIFMGDTGSLLCGFIISVLAIQFIEMRSVPAAPTVAIGILYIPLLDTMRVFVIRIITGKSPFSPDKNHIHHCLLGIGISQIGVVLILALLNLAVIAFVIAFGMLGNMYLLFVLFIFSIVLSIFISVFKPNRAQRTYKL
jgi:UDP-GlcNAc:undecaprenyl-phosphate/decaprenyl-phosphate GlcNAc-1-phosphate transferase